MTKEGVINLYMVGSLLTIGGLIFIFFSVNFGTYLADSWLSNYEIVDTTDYITRVKGYTNSFLVAGGILFSIGLLTLILTYFRQASVNE